MLIIRRRDVVGSVGGGGMGRSYRYRGSGIFGTIARQLFSSGIKKVISSGASSAVAHKVADAVVNGATSASKKIFEIFLCPIIECFFYLSAIHSDTKVSITVPRRKIDKKGRSGGLF